VRTDTNIARAADSEYKEEQERLIREAVEAFVDADWQYQEWLKTQGESQKAITKRITVKVLDFIMVELTMSRLIYDMYYAGEITLEQCMRLIDKWNDTKNKARYR
jgi:hypothetical protein